MLFILRLFLVPVFAVILSGLAQAQTTNSLWSSSTTPANVNEPDTSSVELGIKFTSDVNGTVRAIRFYKGAKNVGKHTVTLWSSGGTKLATATSVNESASGWQTVILSTPIAITAGKTYVASYHTPGYYAAHINYFTAYYSNGILHPPIGAGVYRYSTSSAFPKSVWNNSNYWVDIVFNSGTTPPPPVNGQCGPANGVAVTSAPTTNLCSAGTTSSVTGSGPWAWSCLGSNGGTNASCSAPLKLTVVNGQCGSSNGASLTSVPTTNLCSTGTASSVTGSGPWAWNCAGSNGGTTAQCSAQLQQTIVNGQCGSANNVAVSTVPTTNL